MEGKKEKRSAVYMQILQLIREDGPISRVDISDRLGMARSAVTKLVNEMMEYHILEEVGMAHQDGSQQKGRYKILLDVCRDHWFTVGVFIGATEIYIGLTTLSLDVLEKRHIARNKCIETEGVIAQVREEVDKLLKNNCLRVDRILGMGVGIRPEVWAKWTPEMAHLWKVRFIEQMPFPVQIGNAMGSFALYSLFCDTRNKVTSFLYQSTDDLYLSVAHDDQPEKVLEQPTHALGRVCVMPNGIPMEGYPNGSVRAELSRTALWKKLAAYYSAEQTPVLYRLTDGCVENATLSKIIMAIYGSEGSDKVLLPFLDDMMQKSCLMWNNILLSGKVDRLYLHGFWLSEKLFEIVYQYIERYLGKEIAAGISVSPITDICQFLGGIFYGIQVGFNERFRTEEPTFVKVLYEG